MSLSYHIDTAAEQVYLFGENRVSMTGMIGVVEDVAADPDFDPNFRVLFDLSRARYTAELADGDALVAKIRENKQDFTNRFAVVVPSALHVLAKLYCLLANMGGSNNVRCFTDMDEARAWCGMPPAD